MNFESSSKSDDPVDMSQATSEKTSANADDPREGSSLNHESTRDNKGLELPQQINLSNNETLSTDINAQTNTSPTTQPNNERGRAAASTATSADADSSRTGKRNTDPGNWLAFDPTPYHNMYPCPKWFTVNQLIRREYGRNLVPREARPARQTSRLFNPSNFRNNAYSSLYFIQKLQIDKTLRDHRGCVNCLNFNSTGDLLASGSDDRKVNIWNWQENKLMEKYVTGHTQNVFQCKFMPDESHIVTASRDGEVRLITRNGSLNRDSRCSKKLTEHADSVHRIKITSPNTILSCGEDAIVREIDLRAPKASKILYVKHSSRRVPLFSIDTSPLLNPHLLAVSGRNPRVFLYDKRFITSAVESPAPLDIIIPPGLEKTDHIVTSSLFDSTGRSILLSYNDDDIYLVDIDSKEIEHTYRGHRNALTLKSCNWFTDDFIVSGSDDGHFYAWHRDTEHIVMSIPGDESGVVNTIEPHPVNPFMATSGLDHDVKVWVPKSDTWPVPMKGIKKRICDNIRTRESERGVFSRDSDSSDNRLFISLIERLNRNGNLFHGIFTTALVPQLDDSNDSNSESEITSDDDDNLISETSDSNDSTHQDGISHVRSQAVHSQVLQVILSSGAHIFVDSDDESNDAAEDRDANTCVTS